MAKGTEKDGRGNGKRKGKWEGNGKMGALIERQ